MTFFPSYIEMALAGTGVC